MTAPEDPRSYASKVQRANALLAALADYDDAVDEWTRANEAAEAEGEAPSVKETERYQGRMEEAAHALAAASRKLLGPDAERRSTVGPITAELYRHGVRPTCQHKSGRSRPKSCGATATERDGGLDVCSTHAAFRRQQRGER